MAAPNFMTIAELLYENTCFTSEATMILRQFCARHGRSAFTRSSEPLLRSYATTKANSDSRYSRTGQGDAPPTRIRGHPDDPSSILDTIPSAPTPETRSIEAKINALEASVQSLRSSVGAHATTRILTLPVDEPVSSSQVPSKSTTVAPQAPSAPFEDLKSLYVHRRTIEKTSQTGAHVEHSYDPLSILRDPPKPHDLTLPMLLANQTHLGHHTSLWHPGNSRYIFGVRDGIHIISLEETLAHLRRASKVVQEIARRGGIILFIGTRKGQDEIVVNAAKLAQGYQIVDRWVPGSLTNGQQILGGCAMKVVDVQDREIAKYTEKLAGAELAVLKPDLVVCLNPIENEVCLHECGLHNVPTIGVVDTDINPSWVTYPIPANDDSLRSIALIAGCLGRAGEEGQRLRLESARFGQTTYPTRHVESLIQRLDEMQNTDKSDAATGGEAPALG